ncbi:hypothetical protein ABEB36_012620 [Hypothenemus hampei]|uniref:F-box domain-containing protein n=1 Tax=Hypothenemus hampei TaxID=57062 RepID=A0ABD1EBU9_HYPHA
MFAEFGVGIGKTCDESSKKSAIKLRRQFMSIENYCNGLQFGDNFIPKEILIHILSYLSPADILEASMVCKNWFNMTRSSYMWRMKYERLEAPKKAKNLPWYVYFYYFNVDTLVKNTNGEEAFKHWMFICNGGDRLIIEHSPKGCEPMPKEHPDFHGYTSCFTTSYGMALKYQVIELSEKKLLQHIIRTHHPALYASEWFVGRKDCSSLYKLIVICNTKAYKCRPEEIYKLADEIRGRAVERPLPLSTIPHKKVFRKEIDQWGDGIWEKASNTFNVFALILHFMFFRLKFCTKIIQEM